MTQRGIDKRCSGFYGFNVKARIRIMPRRLSALAALTVIFAFLSVSIVYACSGLGPAGVMFQQKSMDGGMANKSPCNQHKEYICKSVRDSILSIQPSVAKADISPQPVASIQFPVKSPTLIVFSPRIPVFDRPFHPVFRISLTLSYLVLRI